MIGPLRALTALDEYLLTHRPLLWLSRAHLTLPAALATLLVCGALGYLFPLVSPRLPPELGRLLLVERARAFHAPALLGFGIASASAALVQSHTMKRDLDEAHERSAN